MDRRSAVYRWLALFGYVGSLGNFPILSSSHLLNPLILFFPDDLASSLTLIILRGAFLPPYEFSDFPLQLAVSLQW